MALPHRASTLTPVRTTYRTLIGYFVSAIFGGAAVTQLLLELRRLKGWTVSGTGLDYRKCFDPMPQGIVFEVCTRLGWDAKVLAALHAMYCQSRTWYAWWGTCDGRARGG